MRGVYEDYLQQVQTTLVEKRETIQRRVAVQEGELESEVKGLRKAPAGYGTRAREEDYALILKRKEAEVELQPINEALAAKAEADRPLNTTSPKSLDEIQACRTSCAWP